MKLVVLILAVGLAFNVRAEIDLPDMDNVTPAPAAKKHPDEPPPPATLNSHAVAPTPPRLVIAGPKDGRITFRNGDTMHGLLADISETGQLDWRYPDAKDSLRFSIQNVMEISLPGGGPPPTGNALVTLTNGDTLRGDVLALDVDTLTLNTTYAGQLKIKRVMVHCLAPQRGSESIIIDGLISLDGWKQIGDANNWQVQNGVLTTTKHGAIGRDLGLPKRCVIEFDMAWEKFPSLQVGLYASQPDAILGNGNSSGYWINLAANSAQFQRAKRNEIAQLGQTEVRRFGRSIGKGHIGIYVDVAKKEFTLALDGHVLKTWSEPDEFAGDGTCLILSSLGGNQSVHISNLVVRQWLGDLEESPTVTGKLDLLTLANSDHVSGHLKSIQNGSVTVNSDVAPLAIPLERVTEIYLSSDDAELARRMANDLVAVFHDGSRVTVALDALDEKHLIGYSENFGKIQLDRGMFQELELHIYDEDRLPLAEPEVSDAQPTPNFINNGNGVIIINGGQLQLQQGAIIRGNHP